MKHNNSSTVLTILGYRIVLSQNADHVEGGRFFERVEYKQTSAEATIFNTFL
jgi:hypothetical protein